MSAMYLQNKYTRIYFMIIDRAKIRTISSYTESHHIIPKSIGGTNDPSNLVDLTPREHFICHKLLTKMVEGKNKSKMMYAYRALAIVKNPHRPPFKITSSEFEKLRSLGLRKGVKTSNETKQKISNAKKEKNSGKNNPMYGKKHSAETRDKLSATRKARSGTPGWNIRPACSKEKANKIRESNTGRRWVHDPDTKTRLNVSAIEFEKFCKVGWIPGKGVF